MRPSRIVPAVGAILGGALAAAPLVLSAQLVAQIEAMGGRSVAVEDVDLNLFTESAAISALTWQDEDGREQSVGRLEVEIALWPLMSRDRLQVRRLSLQRLDLSVDLRDRGIAVFMLHPGYVATDMTNNQGDVPVERSARGLIERMEELDLSRTGTFRHARGHDLDW